MKSNEGPLPDNSMDPRGFEAIRGMGHLKNEPESWDQRGVSLAEASLAEWPFIEWEIVERAAHCFTLADALRRLAALKDSHNG